MNIIKAFATKNPCYVKGEKMTPKGIVVHSTGVNNPYLKRYVDAPSEVGTNTSGNHWNNPNASVCVHAFIGYDKNKNVRVAQILPYNYACWGIGRGSNGSFNYDPTGHIQFEMCEDDLHNAAYCKAVFDVAVEYCAELCKQFNFDPKGKNVIVSHEEAGKAGYGSKHVDPTNWWKYHGYTMDKFRQAVYNKLHPTVSSNASGIAAGTELKLNNVKVYASKDAKDASFSKTGTFYAYDNQLYGTRIKITNKIENIGKSVTGFIELSDAKKSLTSSSASGSTSGQSAALSITYQVYDNVKKAWLPNVVDDNDYAGYYSHSIGGVRANLNSGNVIYRVHIKGGKWLDEVKNRNDYAGITGKDIDGFCIKTDSKKTICYRVHLKDSKTWLPWVTGYNINDASNGYAGTLGKSIDAIQVYIK